MTETLQNRRESDQYIQVLATRIGNLSEDIGELKTGINKVNEAISKLAVVEDRQSQMFLALDRFTALTDRWMVRQETHEKLCNQQDKDLRALIADTAKDISERTISTSTKVDERLDALEKASDIQKMLSGWAIGGTGVCLGGLATFIIPRALERIFV